MRDLLKGIVICVVALMILNIASDSYAQNMGRKFFRGLGNIATGWFELPKNLYTSTKEHDWASGTIIGFAKGFWMTAVRTAVGAYDTVTFPFPVPKDYEPVIEPEFAFTGK